MNLNKVMLIGNVTQDPELKKIPSGQSVVSFGVATNRQWTDKVSGEKKKQVEFHNLVAWGKLAEIVGQYIKKGSKIYIEGRLQTRSWDDQSGAKKYKTEIVAENMIMLDRAGTGTDTNNTPTNSTNSNEGEQPAPSQSEPEINVEDIPF